MQLVRALLLAAWLIVSCASARPAAAAVLQTFDQVFEGDDPSEVFEYRLPFDPLTPTLVRFDGFAENLDGGEGAETGVRFQLRWRPNAGDVAGIDLPDETQFPRGVRLPPADPLDGPVRVPLRFEVPVPYSPALLVFAVEGLGPTDNFRFAGELSIGAVPEPAGLAWVLLAMPALLRRPAAPQNRASQLITSRPVRRVTYAA